MWLSSGVPTCVECLAEGYQPEKILVVGSHKEFDGAEQFYDREGRLHWHDPNRPTTTYECDRFHRWDIEGPAFACLACSGGEMGFVGIATQERFCVFDEEQRLIGLSLHVEGYDGRRLIVPVNTAPDGSISLAWPAR